MVPRIIIHGQCSRSMQLLRPSTDHSALVVIGRRACRRHGPWTRRTHRPVEAELGSNACKTARSNIPRIMHRTASACHRRIASGVQKAPAATQWTLLTFLTSDNEHSSRSIQRFHWRPPSGSERDHTTTLPIPALREKNSAASATATKSAIHACTILVRAVHGDRRARRGRLLVARSRTVRVRPKRTAQHGWLLAPYVTLYQPRVQTTTWHGRLGSVAWTWRWVTDGDSRHPALETEQERGLLRPAANMHAAAVQSDVRELD
jgi:hypothetical protein